LTRRIVLPWGFRARRSLERSSRLGTGAGAAAGEILAANQNARVTATDFVYDLLESVPTRLVHAVSQSPGLR
jgi:hypothetical protein